MKTRLGVVPFIALLLPLSPVAAQDTAVGTRITITVPDPDAVLEIDGKEQTGTGDTRTIEAPPRPRGTSGRISVTVRWDPNNYTTLTRTRTINYRAGTPMAVDLSLEEPTDRIRVRYVPTPDDIADAMVDLARVAGSDVVFEPGCGDARITIAAVKAGARRGVGIDIDPERVREARENVRQAGLTNRIEIRQGDALAIRDLSSASVVFLYMGDEFNLLLRPHLWRDLKVGARVVSHRFLMGDWTPDKSLNTVGSDGEIYQLHVWTITEEVKRRLGLAH